MSVHDGAGYLKRCQRKITFLPSYQGSTHVYRTRWKLYPWDIYYAKLWYASLKNHLDLVREASHTLTKLRSIF